MAVNKRKVLDAARKYAQKGAKDKALKEYHSLLKLDPKDAKLHLEIGDCYRRWGQIDEAITQYARVADQYKDDGFDARAVAVFKQILNLDPKRYSAYVSLSELYQRMGLDSEALLTLQAAADGHHKEGNKREALELLRKMATLDPTNTTSRLKVAELLRQEGMERDAMSEYEAVVAELERQGATESILAVQERILELQPDRADVLVSIARRLLQLGKAERAEPFAKRAIQKDPDESDAHEALLEIYKALGNDQELASATRALAKLYRTRGEEDRARELAQRIPLELELEAEGRGRTEESDSAFLSDDELLDEDFLASDTSETSEVSEEMSVAADEEFILDEPEPEPGASDARADPKAVDLPQGDPEQLLAEASVYLRYGKRDKAIASLEGILAREPGHRAALEKLGEAHAEGGGAARAVELWSRAALLARGEGDEGGYAVLRDRIAALDADAAASLDRGASGSEIDEVDAPELETAADAEGLDFEIDVSLGEDDSPAAEDDGDAELALDDSSDSPGASRAELTQPDDDDAEEGIEVDVDVELDDSGDSEDDDSEEDAAEAPSPAVASASEGGGSSTTSQQVKEDLEEAEFYYQQSLFDEAEAIYRRILKVAPKHPAALLRLGEIAAARGNDPADLDSKPASRPAARAARAVTPPGEDSTEVAELSSPDADDEPAVHLDIPPAAAPRRPRSERAAREEAVLPEPEESREEEADLEIAAARSSDDDSGSFDLAAELRDVLEESDVAPVSEGVRSTVEDGFEAIFADFKQGVSATLSEDDYETRYDLGIAYREMGLYEDAIGEFRMCLQRPSRKLESLHLMGLCALDLGRVQDAANHFEQALATPDLPLEQIAGLRFDLGRALEAGGDVDRARAAYEAALEADAAFPGIAERIAGLGSSRGAKLELAGESEGFESFDDLVAEAEDDGASEQTESFESFDDVITEAESAPEEEPVAEALIEDEPEPKKPAPKKPEAKKKGNPGRKKKISFV